MSFKTLSSAIDMLESTLAESGEIVEYRLSANDVEQAAKDVKTLNPGQLKALAGLMRFYYDPSTRKVEAAWVEKQAGNARLMQDLLDRKFVSADMSPRNRRQADVYWLAPKGLVVAQAIRDGKIKA
jgi:hypothetical protein